MSEKREAAKAIQDARELVFAWMGEHDVVLKSGAITDLAKIIVAGRQSAGATARKPIYQARQHLDEEGRWDDVQEATYLACVAEPKFYETRIVYAAPIDDNEARDAMLTALQEVLATPGLQSGLQVMCAAAIAKATGHDVADVIKGV